MKRFFFTAITLAAVAVGCTKSGLLESPKTYEDPITFEPYTGKATMTKATVAETTTIEQLGFSVIGFVEADNGINAASPYLNKDVTKGTDGWTYDGAMYWPDGSELTFVAFGNNASVVNPVNGDYTKLTYVVQTAATEQEDLVISPVKPNCTSTKPNGIEGESGTAVSVRLYHALSRVGFKVKTIGVEGVEVAISDITMRGTFVTSGTFDLTQIAAGEKTLSYELTDPQSADVSYPLFAAGSQPFTTDGTLDAGSNEKTFDIVPTTAEDRWMMIMPGTVGNVTDTEDINGNGNRDESVTPYIKVVYTLEGANQQTAIIPLVKGDTNFEFEIGKAYEFVFTASTQAVGFDVEVGIWQPDTDSDNATDPETETFPLN